MEQQTTFKQKLFGFDKKMVLDYIFAFNKQSKEIEQQLTKQIVELTTEKDELNRQILQLQQQVEAVNAQNTAEAAAKKDLVNSMTELAEAIDTQKSQLSQKDRELQIQNERCRQLQFKSESVEIKARKYDEICQQVGEIIVEAKRMAQELISKMGSPEKAIDQLELDVPKPEPVVEPAAPLENNQQAADATQTAQELTPQAAATEEAAEPTEQTAEPTEATEATTTSKQATATTPNIDTIIHHAEDYDNLKKELDAVKHRVLTIFTGLNHRVEALEKIVQPDLRRRPTGATGAPDTQQKNRMGGFFKQF